MIDKIITNVVKVTVNAAYAAMIGAAAYCLIDSTRRSSESTKLAIKREEVGLPGYETVEEASKHNK